MLRLGIVDFDSSHSAEFTWRMNHAVVSADQWVDGAQVVLGCPGTSVMSPERIPIFTRHIAASGVELVADPREMLGRIDAVLVLSLCGQAHLAGVRPFLEAGLPAYVDKPFTCGTREARELIQLAESHGATLFSSSSLRYAEALVEFHRQADRWGPVHGALAYGPAKRAAGNPGLYHYGIHAVEILFTLLGPGCRTVSALSAPDGEVVTGEWADGRWGTVRGARRGSTAYGFTAFCEQGVIAEPVCSRYAYRNLCREIITSLTTGRPAVPLQETFEIIAFVEAALASEAAGGAKMPLEVL